jgi:hypothetical protein
MITKVVGRLHDSLDSFLRREAPCRAAENLMDGDRSDRQIYR